MPKEVKTTKAKAVKETKEVVETKSAPTFAVIEIAGIQLIVEPDGKYEVTKLDGNKGDKIVVEKVLLHCDNGNVKVGKPYVKDCTVELEIDSQKKGKKVEVYKYKAKARYRKSMGSRPYITRVAVKKIK
ncbi:MAG TPA: 50S ribosomal protein L21 [Candidatus Dojkabacteria bacterium]|nr:50S ribosomal protein L21 [Candidatus Dojkabacteria bacterium]